MTRKIEDLCVAVRKYTDSTGKEKNQYENVGHVLEMDDGSKMYLLKRTFNPAGVPNPDNRDTIIISRFPVRDANAAPQPASATPELNAATPDDEVPF